jgi:hypothetical protein
MSPRPRAVLTLATLLVASAGLAATRGPGLTVHGVAQLGAGDPVSKARVTAVAGRRTTTTTDDAGRFTLDLPLPDAAALGRDSSLMQIWIADRNLHFSAPDGQASIGLLLKLERGADGVLRVIAMSNDPRLAERAARAIVDATRAVLDSVEFTAGLGEPAHDPFPPSLPSRVEVPLQAVSAPPASPASALPPAGVAGAAGAGAAGAASAAGHAASPSGPAAPRSAPMPAYAADSLRYTRTPEDAMSHPAKVAGVAATHPTHSSATADTSHCVCRIAGTIETTGGPLREPLRLIVSLEGLSAPIDTVTLDMGSPRTFDLRRVPCGARRLVVRPMSGKLHYNVLDPDHTLPVTCEHDRRAQPRVVLVPR